MFFNFHPFHFEIKIKSPFFVQSYIGALSRIISNVFIVKDDSLDALPNYIIKNLHVLYIPTNYSFASFRPAFSIKFMDINYNSTVNEVPTHIQNE